MSATLVSLPATDVSAPASASSASSASSAEDAAPALSQPHYDPGVGAALKLLVDQYGATLVGEPGRLRGLLQDECPRAKREISVLLQALDERVPQDLLRVQSGEPIGSLAPRLARRLGEEKAMSADASNWAVRTWAEGLGLVAPADAASVTFDDGDAFSRPEEKGQGPQLDASQQHILDALPPRPVPWLRRAALGAFAAVLAMLAGGAWFFFMQPKIDIIAVEPATPLVGNGKSIGVRLSYDARRAAPQSVEVRFVRGDGNWKPEPTVVNVPSAEASGRGQLAAGSFTFRTSKPAHVTFSYTLVSAGGQRSAPFERTFDISPPVTITDVSVPRGLVVGQGFDLGFRYARGASDIVRIERKVVQSNGTWGSIESAQPVKYGDATGSFDYHFEPFTQAMTSTVEFTLVDADGVRSEPYRVVLAVAPAAPPPTTVPVQRSGAPSALPLSPSIRGLLGTVIGVREVRQQGQATGAGAVVAGLAGALAGRQAGDGRGRDVLTGLGALGGALVGNEAEKYMRGNSAWEITVRMDGGGVRTLRQASAPRARPGDRVRVDRDTVTTL